jgi:hypothetical protein
VSGGMQQGDCWGAGGLLLLTLAHHRGGQAGAACCPRVHTHIAAAEHLARLQAGQGTCQPLYVFPGSTHRCVRESLGSAALSMA